MTSFTAMADIHDALWDCQNLLYVHGEPRRQLAIRKPADSERPSSKAVFAIHTTVLRLHSLFDSPFAKDTSTWRANAGKLIVLFRAVELIRWPHEID